MVAQLGIEPSSTVYETIVLPFHFRAKNLIIFFTYYEEPIKGVTNYNYINGEMQMKLVPDWRNAKRWLSIQFSILGSVASGLWLIFPQIKDNLPEQLTIKIFLTLFVLIAIGRMIDQNKESK